MCPLYSYPDACRAGPAGDGSGKSSPSRTKPNPACHAAPGRAAPSLPLPMACPGPRGTSLRVNGPLSRSIPGPVRSGKSQEVDPGQQRAGVLPAGAGGPLAAPDMGITEPGDPVVAHPGVGDHRRAWLDVAGQEGT